MGILKLKFVRLHNHKLYLSIPSESSFIWSSALSSLKSLLIYESGNEGLFEDVETILLNKISNLIFKLTPSLMVFLCDTLFDMILVVVLGKVFMTELGKLCCTKLYIPLLWLGIFGEIYKRENLIRDTYLSRIISNGESFSLCIDFNLFALFRFIILFLCILANHARFFFSILLKWECSSLMFIHWLINKVFIIMLQKLIIYCTLKMQYEYKTWYVCVCLLFGGFICLFIKYV